MQAKQLFKSIQKNEKKLRARLIIGSTAHREIRIPLVVVVRLAHLLEIRIGIKAVGEVE